MSGLLDTQAHQVIAGILLPQSVLNSNWFAVFAAFVGINTVVYMGLTFSKLIPWPEPFQPGAVRRFFGVQDQEEAVQPIRPHVGRPTPAESSVQDIARAFGWLGIIMVVRGAVLVFTGTLMWSDFAAIFIGLAFVAIAQVLARTKVNPSTASWIWGVSIAGVAVMSTIRASEGDIERIGFVLVLTVVLGAVSLTWPSFAVPVALLAAAFLYIDLAATNYLDPVWVWSFIGAVVASALLLVLRRRSLRVLEDVDRLENQLGTTDVLTGVLTRQGLLTLGPYILRGARRQEQPVFAMLIAVDDLDRANRDYGTDYGDDVLRATAEAIKSAARDADLLGRWTGDAFVLFGIGGQQSIDALTHRIGLNLEQSPVAVGKWPLGVRIGAATGDPEDSLEGLVTEAGTALPPVARAELPSV